MLEMLLCALAIGQSAELDTDAEAADAVTIEHEIDATREQIDSISEKLDHLLEVIEQCNDEQPCAPVDLADAPPLLDEPIAADIDPAEL